MSVRAGVNFCIKGEKHPLKKGYHPLYHHFKQKYFYINYKVNF